ncbi:HSP20-like chaperone [Xylaria sp. FL1777]|nr:HSP20-like chaperone [Xylaria sp. FL1777]
MNGNNNNHNNNGNNHPFGSWDWDWGQSAEDYQQSGPTNAQFPNGFPFNAAGFAPWSGPHWYQGRRGASGNRHTGAGDHTHEGTGDEETHVEEAAETDTATKNSHEHGSTHPPPPPPPPPHSHHHHGPFGLPRGRGGRCRRGGGRHHHPPPPHYNGPFDFGPLMHALSAHPLAHAWRNYAHQSRDGAASHAPQDEGQTQQQQDSAFSPPIDIFSDEKAYVLHVALPGVAKEDVSVNWNGHTINISGVAYRPGSEEFLNTLVSGERNVGMFERKIKLPPPGSNDNEDVDGYGITAKMENGILIVTVPKTEKDWTEVHKVEIE